jgi:hypothetical protein
MVTKDVTECAKKWQKVWCGVVSKIVGGGGGGVICSFPLSLSSSLHVRKSDAEQIRHMENGLNFDCAPQ